MRAPGPGPEVVTALPRLRELTGLARRGGGRVGFVPTMGALHAGHLALVRAARERAGLVVVSVFVNPTQFGPGEDLERYPRRLEADAAAAGEAGAHVVYAPEVSTLYPPGDATEVRVNGGLTEGLCAPHRPGHFAGVATVVAKLFVQVGPCAAVFGRKDYQQLKVVERLVTDLCLEVEVVGIPTVREPDGLALSSRNGYLGPAERLRATGLVRGLSAARSLLATGPGTVTAGELRRAASGPIAETMDSIDYVEVRDPDTLARIGDEAAAPPRVLVAVAARIGSTRLIDNLVVGEDPDPLP